MDESSKSKRKILGLIIIVALIALVGFFFGPQVAATYYLKAGETAFEEEKFENAMAYLKKSNYFNAKNFKTHVLLGRTFVALNKQRGKVHEEDAQNIYRESIGQFNVALTLGLRENNYPSYGEFLDDYGTAYWRTGEYDKADKLFLERIERYPNSSFLARFLVAVDYTERLNRPKEARDIILPAFSASNVITRLLPDAYAVMLRLSTYFEDSENVEKYAKLILDTAEARNIEARRFAHTHLAALYSRRGDLKTAEEWIKKADELLKEPGRHGCLLANFYVDNKKYNLAIETAKKRDEPRCWAALSRAYAKLGQKGMAKLYAEKTLEVLKPISRKDIFTFQGIAQMEEILANL